MQRSYKNRAVIVQAPQLCIEISPAPGRLPYGGHAEIVRWLCDPHVFWTFVYQTYTTTHYAPKFEKVGSIMLSACLCVCAFVLPLKKKFKLGF